MWAGACGEFGTVVGCVVVSGIGWGVAAWFPFVPALRFVVCGGICVVQVGGFGVSCRGGVF